MQVNKNEEIIVNNMLKDIREEELIPHLNEIERNKWNDNFETRIDIYTNKKHTFRHKKINSNSQCYTNKKIDAERWRNTLNSYKNYECFSEYTINDEPYLCYRSNQEDVRIPADLLTNVNTIKALVNNCVSSNLSKEEKAIINAFYRVSFTIGAFCPIWHNPSPGRGAYTDIIWSKLNKSGLYDENGNLKNDYVGINERENEVTLNNRKDNDLFMILPKKEGMKTIDVISRLYFQDYFDSNWKLISPVRTTLCKNNSDLQDKEHIFNFIKQISILIVQRSYRIITNYQDNILREEDKRIIKIALERIGLTNAECIYVNKNENVKL